MVDQQLSEALAAFVGRPGHLDDASPEASLVEVVGDTAPDLMPRIIAILEELDALTAPPSTIGFVKVARGQFVNLSCISTRLSRCTED